MKGPKPPTVNLSDAERQGLEKLIKAHNTEQGRVPRARIILAASQGLNNAQIARELHITVDTARQWRDRWLELQPIPLTELQIVFHYTPKHASWMNQVEIWLSILVRKLLKRGSFTSVEDLKAKIRAFAEYFNRTMAKPFKWTWKGKALAA